QNVNNNDFIHKVVSNIHNITDIATLQALVIHYAQTTSYYNSLTNYQSNNYNKNFKNNYSKRNFKNNFSNNWKHNRQNTNKSYRNNKIKSNNEKLNKNNKQHNNNKKSNESGEFNNLEIYATDKNQLQSGSRIIIDTNIGKLRALLDTGSNINICNTDIYYHPLLQEQRQFRRKPFIIKNLKSQIKVNKYVPLQFKTVLGVIKADFYESKLSKDMNVDIIIGRNLLMKLGFQLQQKYMLIHKATDIIQDIIHEDEQFAQQLDVIPTPEIVTDEHLKSIQDNNIKY